MAMSREQQAYLQWLAAQRQQQARARQQQQGSVAGPVMGGVGTLAGLWGLYKMGKGIYNNIPTAAQLAEFKTWIGSQFGTEAVEAMPELTSTMVEASPLPAWSSPELIGKMDVPFDVQLPPGGVGPGDPGYEQMLSAWNEASGGGGGQYLTNAGADITNGPFDTAEFYDWATGATGNAPAADLGYATPATGYSGAMSGGPGALAVTAEGLPPGFVIDSTGNLVNASSGASGMATDIATGGVQMADGSVVLADGTVVAPEAGWLAGASPYLGAAGAALGAYGVYNATQMDDKRKAALSGGLSGAGMGMGTAMLALGAANMWNPVGWALIGGGALAGAGLGGAFAHKSTKQRQAERWEDLYNQGYTGQQEFINWSQTEGEKLKAWQEQQKALGAGEFNFDPNDPDAYQVSIMGEPVTIVPELVWGEVAPMDLVGSDYFGKWNEQQRYEFNRRALEAGLYEHKKGGFEFRDKEAAAALAAEISAGTYDPEWRVPGNRKILDDPSTPFYDESKERYQPTPTAPEDEGPARGEGPAQLDENAPDYTPDEEDEEDEDGGGIVNTPSRPESYGFQDMQDVTEEQKEAWAQVAASSPWIQAEQAATNASLQNSPWAAMWQQPQDRVYRGPTPDWVQQIIGSGAAGGIGAALGSIGASSGSPENDWERAVASGKYRRGSKAAGGYVDNATGKWYPGNVPVPA